MRSCRGKTTPDMNRNEKTSPQAPKLPRKPLLRPKAVRVSSGQGGNGSRRQTVCPPSNPSAVESQTTEGVSGVDKAFCLLTLFIALPALTWEKGTSAAKATRRAVAIVLLLAAGQHTWLSELFEETSGGGLQLNGVRRCDRLSAGAPNAAVACAVWRLRDFPPS